MPIYEYVCKQCGHEFETLQKVSDEPLKTCPACARECLKKKISAAGFRLSGSGWYETDFKSDRKKNLAQGDSANKDGSAGGAEGKADKSGGEKADKSGGEKAGKSSGGGKEAVA
jgi:putative FmdB family regulatory protein